MLVLLFFTFLAGLVTIMAPCIWPLLPIILSASSVGGKQRPLGITLGIMTSFTIFTLSISYVERIFHIDPNLFRIIAVVAIGLLGISMLIPSLGMRLEDLINHLLKPFRKPGKKPGEGFLGGYTIGFSTGLVWAPCSGPILATVATLAATQEVNSKVILITLAYVFGLGIPLFIFSLAGSWLFKLMGRFTKYTVRIQQLFGLVMIIAALLIYTNYDKVIQLKILKVFPSYGNFLSKFEENKEVNEQLRILRGAKEPQKAIQTNLSGLPDLGEAPEFVGISHWLNTEEPLTLQDLRGKVVLIDFWTYTCINCVRTLPHVTAWYDKYKDDGFVIVGVHTPEFAFEKETKNVEQAIKQFKINYPVAQDNDYKTWRAYDNNYWPAEYLIDAKGHIRRTHFGEGSYDETEEAIRQLLQEAGNSVGDTTEPIKDQTPRYVTTPETYLGINRMERFVSKENPTIGEKNYSLPSGIPQDNFAYEGTWNLGTEAATAKEGSVLEIHFLAEKVFLVITPKEAGDKIKVFIDGKPVDNSMAGTDVKDGELLLDVERLYSIIDLKGSIESHILRLEFLNDGISVFAFTFG